MVESYLLSVGMVQTNSWLSYDPSTIRLTSYFSLFGQWNLFIYRQLFGKFLGDLMKFSFSDTVRNPSLKANFRQHVSWHRMCREKLRKLLGRIEHSYDVIPITLYGTYCWGDHSALTNQNCVLIWRHDYVNEGWWNLGDNTWNKVCAYIQGSPDLQAGPELDRGLALTWLSDYTNIKEEFG